MKRLIEYAICVGVAVGLWLMLASGAFGKYRPMSDTVLEVMLITVLGVIAYDIITRKGVFIGKLKRYASPQRRWDWAGQLIVLLIVSAFVIFVVYALM